MLIIESTKYIELVFRVDHGFVGWWSKLEKKFILGSKDNLNNFIKRFTNSHPSITIVVYIERSYFTKDKHQVRIFLCNDFTNTASKNIEANKNKIIYRINPEC